MPRIAEWASGSPNGFGSHRVRATPPDCSGRAAHCVYITLHHWLYTARYGVMYKGLYKPRYRVVYGPSYRGRYSLLPPPAQRMAPVSLARWIAWRDAHTRPSEVHWLLPTFL